MRLPSVVDPDITLQEFIDRLLPMDQLPAFPVAVDKQLAGILRLRDMMDVRREDLRTTTVRQIMIAANDRSFVELGTPLAEAREIMQHNGIGALAVLNEEGKLVGFLV